ncbi:ABC transporter ATP-binding protein [Mesorhizobium sp.]|uniref:ABC transporter ATP-binding protein n=1 Tax=Mesorhizobium sp. TaxID=1871066 RepID=UPI000FE652A2|nr:ABC transporter ATP-binding protein [Mesorhizobium sp.]RWG07807.1 MAG: ABC transporter ATP-binding protein [Mesorhizobium sp.]RWH02882.1 MAG: ABC transporter ATP-binding protein [Mesorhizobium sp.]TIN44947.1 MAG: ABC transporter ATP-binding protein [Mesorhizobium sp.]TIR95594.1 MAG: ABC transporter ATP-binding protein [Mesorhizobium sp.]TIR98312.1 MAG: ABC transporter ATP-binding protein [Mesorhizobium sp.]
MQTHTAQSLAATAAKPASAPLLRIEGLTVDFGGVRVIRGMDLTLTRGDSLGIVGESGSGKSVTWLAALGLLPKTAAVSGKVRLDGEELLGAAAARLDRIRGGRLAMIFQDPSSALNPVVRIGRQVGEVLARHQGLSGSSVRAEVKRLFELVGLPDAARRFDAYPHQMSGGQNQRVMIAMALAGGPDVLVADEPTTALDATIQAQILELLTTVRRETGMALVLISHDLGVVSETCERIMVMYAGNLVETGHSDSIFGNPQHPYTRGLLAALPSFEGALHRLVPIEGQVPEPANMPPGCPFAPRCPQRMTACETAVPPLRQIEVGHRSACVAEMAPAAGQLQKLKTGTLA